MMPVSFNDVAKPPSDSHFGGMQHCSRKKSFVSAKCDTAFIEEIHKVERYKNKTQNLYYAI